MDPPKHGLSHRCVNFPWVIWLVSLAQPNKFPGSFSPFSQAATRHRRNNEARTVNCSSCACAHQDLILPQQMLPDTGTNPDKAAPMVELYRRSDLFFSRLKNKSWVKIKDFFFSSLSTCSGWSGWNLSANVDFMDEQAVETKGQSVGQSKSHTWLPHLALTSVFVFV